MNLILPIGRYFIMLQKVFGKFTKCAVLKDLIFKEIESLIISSLGIVSFISFFVGGVVSIQTALNLENPLLPKNLIGFATRQSVILEFAPTFISVIVAGKVGSFITSSIGTMRVTEQIDALEVMGINTYNYLIFPKIVALSLYPFVITISMALGILGGYVACVYGGFSSSNDYIEGIQLDFIPFHVGYAYIKTVIFSFALSTIPAYHGYFMQGGALDVGRSSTKAVVYSSIIVLIFNFLLTDLLLA